jgi:hypothetical protein
VHVSATEQMSTMNEHRKLRFSVICRRACSNPQLTGIFVNPQPARESLTSSGGQKTLSRMSKSSRQFWLEACNAAIGQDKQLLYDSTVTWGAAVVSSSSVFHCNSSKCD